MFLENKKIFLAGSTGMVGTGILKYLLTYYPSVRIQAAYHKNTKPFIEDKRVQYVYGDLRTVHACRKMVRGCDGAIMAAAYTAGVASTLSDPRRQVDDNVIMNMCMLEAFRLEKVIRAVFIGSSTLYQEFDGAIKEDELDLSQDPHQAYFGVGWAMRFLEQMCKFWHEKAGIEFVIARAANVFGPYTKFDPAVSHFIPAIIRKAVEKQDPFQVWGSPDVARDVVYVEDFARAIIMMLDNSRVNFDIFNVGSGTTVTVGEVVQWALRFSQHDLVSVNYVDNGLTTIRSRQLDCSKIKQVLGWAPEYSTQEGILKLVQWWKENRRRWKK